MNTPDQEPHRPVAPTPTAGTLVEGINAGIAAGQCACDIRNPQGACCPRNVSDLVKELQQEGTPHSGA